MMFATTLRLGVIGMSEGNGHPYSWSAICNGYNKDVMATCPFPVIPQYLARQSFPADTIADAVVTHIWTQDKKISSHIAEATNIPHVVNRLDDMLGKVDAVLLARDDAVNHLKHSRIFLNAGIPIYIDKPIAITLADLEDLYALQRYEGQIFSCSALRFAPGLLQHQQLEEIVGPIRHIAAYTPKHWETYAIHMIDPVLSLMSLYEVPFTIRGVATKQVQSCLVAWETGLTTSFTALGAVDTQIFVHVFGEKKHHDIVFTDTFSIFKTALQAFISGVRSGTTVTSHAEHAQVVNIIERGISK